MPEIPARTTLEVGGNRLGEHGDAREPWGARVVDLADDTLSLRGHRCRVLGAPQLVVGGRALVEES